MQLILLLFLELHLSLFLSRQITGVTLASVTLAAPHVSQTKPPPASCHTALVSITKTIQLYMVPFSARLTSSAVLWPLYYSIAIMWASVNLTLKHSLTHRLRPQTHSLMATVAWLLIFTGC